MGRVVIVDQIDSAQVTMPMSECPQLLERQCSALFASKHAACHLSAVNDQEEQDVDRAVPRVIELTLRNRAGDRMPDGDVDSKTWKLGFSSAQTTQKPRRADRSALA